MCDGIRRLHWNLLPAEVASRLLPECEVVMAVWPAPMDADFCFSEAGFADFEDSDDTWDQQWREVIERAFLMLERFGPARLSKGIEVYEICQSGLIRRLIEILGLVNPPTKRVQLSVLEQVIVAADDHHFGDVVINFGQPTKASLRVGQGHPVLWIGFRRGCVWAPKTLVENLAEKRPVERTPLKWEVLIPGTKI